MKSNFKLLVLFTLVGLVFQSCSDDDGEIQLSAPTISNFEYGEGSEHSTEQVAYKGSDIHLEAEITAEATVSSISIDIHAHDLEVGEGEVEWDFEQTYTDADYLVINPTFHEHIDIPSDIPAGEYHILLTVTDELGNSTEAEGHVEILDPISISGFDMDESVVRGEDFHVEFMIAALNGIHDVTVDVHAHGLEVGEGEVEWDFEQSYSEKYHEQSEVEFHEHIDVPATAPAGEYHILFIIEDEEGNTFEYDTHIDVTAS
ncbi:MAG: protein containing PKD domain-containing protein [Pseudozobellia sp.]|nr:protein containing PKD domain-containing protein [Pseudozobellia sp.]|tara:strand:- start:1168 stop:1944 length:777 start_codon:yes stop_codon:yes gene_type:complete